MTCLSPPAPACLRIQYNTIRGQLHRHRHRPHLLISAGHNQSVWNGAEQTVQTIGATAARCMCAPPFTALCSAVTAQYSQAVHSAQEPTNTALHCTRIHSPSPPAAVVNRRKTLISHNPVTIRPPTIHSPSKPRYSGTVLPLSFLSRQLPVY